MVNSYLPLGHKCMAYFSYLKYIKRATRGNTPSLAFALPHMLVKCFSKLS